MNKLLTKFRFKNCTLKNTPRFTIKGKYYGKVVKVYDGDSISVVMNPFGQSKPHLFSVRLGGIDTPEIRGGTEHERVAATVVQRVLEKKILDHMLTVNCQGLDKYGRVLADIQMKGISINAWLKVAGLAKEYGGKTKTPWTTEELDYITNFSN